ncbi:MAG: M48 family metalloprotease [Elusimicrobia bacterium]|nr:M48 family metalloprotease [Candidatus Omnitrophota bacterium]MCG2725725.1 M48 family metalloprotease [Elusimicrobiota bacterium]
MQARKQLLNFILLAVIFLAIPVFGYIVSKMTLSYMDKQVKTGLDFEKEEKKLEALKAICNTPEAQKEPPCQKVLAYFESDEYKFALNPSILELCSRGEYPELKNSCELAKRMGVINFWSITAAKISIGLLLIIFVCGFISNYGRLALLLTFRPLLIVSKIVLAFLTVINGILLAVSVYYAEMLLIHRVHLVVVVSIALGGIVAAYSIFATLFSSNRASTRVFGEELSKEKYKNIWELVQEISEKMNAHIPDHIIAGIEPNFYVTQADVKMLDKKFSGRTMYISIPMLKFFSRDEFSSIIAHELAHYKGLDTQYSLHFYPIYKGLQDGGQALEMSGGAFRAAAIPAVMLFNYLYNSFAEAENKISRNRELAADAESVKMFGAHTFAKALLKTHAFSEPWSSIMAMNLSLIKEGKCFKNISKTYSETIKNIDLPELIKNIGASDVAHPTDSHPAFPERLKAIGLETPHSDISLLPETGNLQLLIQDYEEIEEKVTDKLNMWMEIIAKIQSGTEETTEATEATEATEGTPAKRKPKKSKAR